MPDRQQDSAVRMLPAWNSELRPGGGGSPRRLQTVPSLTLRTSAEAASSGWWRWVCLVPTKDSRFAAYNPARVLCMDGALIARGPSPRPEECERRSLLADSAKCSALSEPNS